MANSPLHFTRVVTELRRAVSAADQLALAAGRLEKAFKDSMAANEFPAEIADDLSNEAERFGGMKADALSLRAGLAKSLAHAENMQGPLLKRKRWRL